MRVLVVASARFDRTPDGTLWTSNASLGHGFWARYLDVFQSVRLLVRTRSVLAPSDPSFRVTGEGIDAISLPDFRGPLSYARHRGGIRRAARKGLAECEAIVLRIPAMVASTVFHLRETGRPFAVEVVGDPWDVFAPGSVKTPWRALLRHRQTFLQKRIVGEATAAAYVTQEALQQRYPCPPDAFSTSYSSVVLRDGDFVDSPRAARAINEPPALVTVGSLNQVYKGVDTLLDAIGWYRRQWGPVRMAVVGDGSLRGALEQQCRRLGISDCVRFVGRVADPAAVRGYLDQADLFVLTSRTEGLPRAMLEAMARGLPCLGTNIGGIPELLDPDDLVGVDQPHELARRLRAVLHSPRRLAEMSQRNWSRANEYAEPLLRARRIALYDHLLCRTRSWFAGRAAVEVPT